MPAILLKKVPPNMARKGSGAPNRVEAKQRVKTARGRSSSSTRWLQRQLNDPYVQEARRLGYRSRAAFKLIDIDRKYKLLTPNLRVIDLGAAPGSWCQVVAERIGVDGKIFALDLLEFDSIRNVEAFVGDFRDQAIHGMLQRSLNGYVGLVLSDMGASATGHSETDHLRSAMLAEMAFEFATEVLAPGGAFVVKLLQGFEEVNYVTSLRERFAKVDRIKPPASRDRSAEMYVVARGFTKKSRV